jgi:hypothetical protein
MILSRHMTLSLHTDPSPVSHDSLHRVSALSYYCLRPPPVLSYDRLHLETNICSIKYQKKGSENWYCVDYSALTLPSPQTQEGSSILRLVAIYDSPDLIDTLAAKGADVNARNDNVTANKDCTPPYNRTSEAYLFPKAAQASSQPFLSA